MPVVATASASGSETCHYGMRIRPGFFCRVMVPVAAEWRPMDMDYCTLPRPATGILVASRCQCSGVSGAGRAY